MKERDAEENSKKLMMIQYGIMEQCLCDLWSCVLKRDDVKTYDEFFSICGDSMLALGIIEQIKTRFGWNISLGDFISHPTIESLLELRTNVYITNLNKSIMRMSPKGDNTAIVFIHPISGVTFSNSKLISHLSRDRACYSVQSPHLTGCEIPTELDELAEVYAEMIYDELGERPFHLIGWDYGGIIGYEIAKIADDMNLELHKLVIIDGLQDNYLLLKSEDDFVKSFCNDLNAQIFGYVDIEHNQRENRTGLAEISEALLGKIINEKDSLQFINLLFSTYKIHVEMLKNYQFTIYEVPCLYLHNNKNTIFSAMDGVDVLRKETDFSAHEMMNNKNIPYLLECIDKYLND